MTHTADRSEPLVHRQVSENLNAARPLDALTCESSLRVAAAAVGHASAQQITATQVVSTLGSDDPTQIETLAEQLATEFGLHAELRARGNSFSVRFSRE